MIFNIQHSTFNIFKLTLKILSSKIFLLWLMGGWVIYYVIMAIWTNETFAQFTESLEGNPLAQAPFVLFLACGYLNILRVSQEISGKGKLQLLAWLALPVGALVFLTGLFASIVSRQFEWLIVGQDHVVRPRWSSESYTVASIKPGIKERFLDIDIGTGKGIFAYEPKLTIMDGQSKTFEVGAFPPAKVEGAYYHILNFGLAPGIRFSEGGAVKDEGYMPLRILTPGSSDYFEIAPYPYRFLISMEPERILRKGKMKAAEFNIKTPLYKVRVFEGEKVIAEGISKEGIRFNNLALDFFEPTFWFQLEVVRDPGVPIILSGLALMIIGIPLSSLRALMRFFSKVETAG